MWLTTYCWFAKRYKTYIRYRKFQIDSLGDHLCNCTAHSGAEKSHDWTVDQLTDLIHTTTKVKTQQVVKSRGVLDLRIAHNRVGRSTDPTLNGHLRYPNNLTTQLLVKYGNITLTTTTFNQVWCHLYLPFLVRLGVYIANLFDFYSYRLIGKLTVFCIFRSSTCATQQWTENVKIYSLRLQLYVLILT